MTAPVMFQGCETPDYYTQKLEKLRRELNVHFGLPEEGVQSLGEYKFIGHFVAVGAFCYGIQTNDDMERICPVLFKGGLHAATQVWPLERMDYMDSGMDNQSIDFAVNALRIFQNPCYEHQYGPCRIWPLISHQSYRKALRFVGEFVMRN